MVLTSSRRVALSCLLNRQSEVSGVGGRTRGRGHRDGIGSFRRVVARVVSAAGTATAEQRAAREQTEEKAELRGMQIDTADPRKVKMKHTPPPSKARATAPWRFDGKDAFILAEAPISVTMLSVDEPGVLPLGVTEGGVTLQVAY